VVPLLLSAIAKELTAPPPAQPPSPHASPHAITSHIAATAARGAPRRSRNDVDVSLITPSDIAKTR
jgi:hypothetical protein